MFKSILVTLIFLIFLGVLGALSSLVDMLVPSELTDMEEDLTLTAILADITDAEYYAEENTNFANMTADEKTALAESVLQLKKKHRETQEKKARTVILIHDLYVPYPFMFVNCFIPFSLTKHAYGRVKERYNKYRYIIQKRDIIIMFTIFNSLSLSYSSETVPLSLLPTDLFTRYTLYKYSRIKSRFCLFFRLEILVEI